MDADSTSADASTRITWCHPLTLGGIETRPQWHVRRRFARRLKFLQIPADLTGQDRPRHRRVGRLLLVRMRAPRGEARARDRHVLLGSLRQGRISARARDAAFKGRASATARRRTSTRPRWARSISCSSSASSTTCGRRSQVLDRIRRRHGRHADPAKRTRSCRRSTRSYPLVSFFPGDGLEAGLPHEFCSRTDARSAAADAARGGLFARSTSSTRRRCAG